MEKSPEAFRTISEVATELDVPQHVLRFWEGKFSAVKPMKRGGGRRYYRPQDIELLRGIRQLLYGEGYTIRGVQKILRDQGIRHVCEIGSGAVSVSDTPALMAAVSQAQNVEATPFSEPQITADGPNEGLNEEQMRLLQASLFELTEIKKTLDEADE